MNEEFNLVYVDDPDEANTVLVVIGPGIHHYNERQAGDNNYQHLCFVLRSTEQEIVGGVIGATYWNWFYLELLWVKDGLRGRGFGSSLLTHAEDEARKRGAKNVYLDTFSFQAPGFYQKHGYQVFGELEDFPAGHQRFFLNKQL